MHRLWWIRLVLVLVLAAAYFAEYRHYMGGWALLLVMIVLSMVVVAVRKRRGELRPLPPYIRKLPPLKLILIGAGLVLAAFAWLIFGFFFFDSQNAQNAYVLMVPFAILVSVGLAMIVVSLWAKLVQLMWDRL